MSLPTSILPWKKGPFTKCSEFAFIPPYKRTKKEKEEKKRKKEESTSFDPKYQQALRKQDKKRDDVEVEGQGFETF